MQCSYEMHGLSMRSKTPHQNIVANIGPYRKDVSKNMFLHIILHDCDRQYIS